MHKIMPNMQAAHGGDIEIHSKFWENFLLFILIEIFQQIAGNTMCHL